MDKGRKKTLAAMRSSEREIITDSTPSPFDRNSSLLADGVISCTVDMGGVAVLETEAGTLPIDDYWHYIGMTWNIYGPMDHS